MASQNLKSTDSEGKVQSDDPAEEITGDADGEGEEREKVEGEEVEGEKEGDEAEGSAALQDDDAHSSENQDEEADRNLLEDVEEQGPPRIGGVTLKNPTDDYLACLYKSLTACSHFMDCSSCDADISKCLTCTFRNLSVENVPQQPVPSEEFWRCILTPEYQSANPTVENDRYEVGQYFNQMVKTCKNKVNHLFSWHQLKTELCLTEDCKHRHAEKAVKRPAMLLKVPTKSGEEGASSGDSSLSVQKLLDKVQQPERKKNATCKRCGQKGVEKKQTVVSCSRLLAISLNRNANNEGEDPNNETVMTDFIIQVSEVHFVLRAVVLLNGNTLEDGQYYCYVEIGDYWYKMSGDELEVVDGSTVSGDNEKSVLLLYQQKSTQQINDDWDKEKQAEIRKRDEAKKRKRARARYEHAQRQANIEALKSKIGQIVPIAKVSQLNPKVDIKHWRQYHDMAICVIVSDGKIAQLVRTQIAADILKNLGREEHARYFIQNRLKDEVSIKIEFEDRDFQMFDFFQKLKPARFSGNVIGEVERNYQTWERALPNSTRNSDILELLTNTLTNLHDVYKQHPTYDWSEDLAVLITEIEGTFAQLNLAVTTNATAIISRMLGNEEVYKTILVNMLQRILQTKPLPMSDLLTSLELFANQEDRSNRADLAKIARPITEIRNDVIHKKKLKEFANGARRHDFLKQYEFFVEQFPFKDCMPIVNKTEKMQEYMSPKMNMDEYHNIISKYDELFEEYEADETEIQKLTRDTNTCMTDLEKCHEALATTVHIPGKGQKKKQSQSEVNRRS